jgi:hypothetical protein
MKLFRVIAFGSILAGLFTGCGQKSAAPAQTINPADVTNPLVSAKRTADKTIDVAYINQAAQLFNVQEGRYPKSLDEMVPKYIAQVPTPPLGYQLNYNATTGEATISRTP